MRIRLETRAGHLVTQGETTPGRIPLNIVHWGVRVFVYQQDLTDLQPDDGPSIYRETSPFWLIEGTTWKEDRS